MDYAMILIRLHRWTKEYWESLKLNRALAGLLTSFLTFIIFINLAYNSQVMRSYGLQVSLADCFISSSNTILVALMIIPAIVFLMNRLFSYDFNSNFALRQGGRRTLWGKQIYQIFLLSVSWTMWIAVFTFGAGGLFSTSYINWGEQDSAFYSATKQLRPEITIQNVIFFSILVMIFRVFILCLLLQLLNWITSRKFWGWIFMITVGCFDWYDPRNSLLYGKISFNYGNWCDFKAIPNGFFYALGLILAISLLGAAISERKDFLNE